MGNLIIIALAMLASSLLTAWILHRQKTGQSPVPSLPARASVSDNGEQEPVYVKGRPEL
jgi:hypothetical protein